MSGAKFTAARQLIEEKHYEEARAILKTINDPKAEQWLTKLDNLAPTNKQTAISEEAERFYKAENKKRRRKRLMNGIELIVGSIFPFGLGAIFSSRTIGGVPQQTDGSGSLFILLGIIMVIAGIIIISRRNKD